MLGHLLCPKELEKARWKGWGKAWGTASEAPRELLHVPSWRGVAAREPWLLLCSEEWL